MTKSSGSTSNKRQRTSRVSGPVQRLDTAEPDARTDNPLLKNLENRSIDIIRERRKTLATPSSVSVSMNIWANELVIEMAAQMVNDIRENIANNRFGCSVCYMIAGEEGTEHSAGASCPKMPLTSTTVGWSKFKI